MMAAENQEPSLKPTYDNDVNDFGHDRTHRPPTPLLVPSDNGGPVRSMARQAGQSSH